VDNLWIAVDNSYIQEKTGYNESMIIKMVGYSGSRGPVKGRPNSFLTKGGRRSWFKNHSRRANALQVMWGVRGGKTW